MSEPVNTDALREVGRWLEGEDGPVFLSSGRKAISTLADEVDRLRAAIENAPHREKCRPEIACTCWKADAL